MCLLHPSSSEICLPYLTTALNMVCICRGSHWTCEREKVLFFYIHFIFHFIFILYLFFTFLNKRTGVKRKKKTIFCFLIEEALRRWRKSFQDNMLERCYESFRVKISSDGKKEELSPKSAEKELFKINAEEGAISNERPRRSYFGSHFFSQNLSWQQ